MKKKIGIAKTTIHKGWHDLDELNTKIGHFEHCGCPECISKKVKHMVIDKVYMTHKKLLSVTHQTESLRRKLDLIRDNLIKVTIDRAFATGGTPEFDKAYHRFSKEIYNAFLSEWERVKPKESHISYHNEDDVRYLHEEGGKELVLWEEGYNKALSAADTAIKEILK